MTQSLKKKGRDKMAIRSYEEIMEQIQKRLGDDSSDEALSFVEDISDTLKQNEKEQTEDWKTKFEENDKMWREKYRNRFFNKGEDSEQEKEVTRKTDPEPLPEDNSPTTFDELFETK